MIWRTYRIRWKCDTCFRCGVMYSFMDKTWSLGAKSHVLVGDFPDNCWRAEHRVVEGPIVSVPEGCLAIWSENAYQYTKG
jgi:hypothetical protein